MTRDPTDGLKYQKVFVSTNPRLQYCVDNSLDRNVHETKLFELTLVDPQGTMMGDPLAVQLLKSMLSSKNATKVLDIGTFTGVSALAWALTVPENGQVHTFDIDHTKFDKMGKVCATEAGVIHKIITHTGPAIQGLNTLIKSGESGTFDLAFIDADKGNYDKYYELSLQLLKVGGIIAVDNAIWYELVMKPEAEQDSDTKVIHSLNQKIHKDNRVFSTLLPFADGLHIAIKK